MPSRAGSGCPSAAAPRAAAGPVSYAEAKRVRQLADVVAARVLAALGAQHDLLHRWTGPLGAAREEREGRG